MLNNSNPRCVVIYRDSGVVRRLRHVLKTLYSNVIQYNILNYIKTINIFHFFVQHDELDTTTKIKRLEEKKLDDFG